MVEADCDIIVCMVGWAVRNGSVEDIVGLENREVINAGENWKVRMGSGRAEYEGKQKNIHSYTHLGKEKQMKNAQTRCKTKLLYSQTRGMHTSSAEYTTFITFELINRKSGGKATRITVFRKRRKEKKQKKAAHSNDELICPRERKRG